MKIIPELNNRELSIVIWLFIFLVWVLTQTKIRKAAGSLIRAFFAKKLVYGYISMLLYIVLIITPFYFMGIWGFYWIKNTILWIVCVAFGMLMQFSKATDENYFKNSVKDNLKILVILEFIINLYVFSLWIELALIPFSALIGGMIAIANQDEKYKNVKRLLDSILTIMGFVFLFYAIYIILTDFEYFANKDNLIDFILPILLTIMFLPFVYLTALYSNYEILFTRMPYFIKDKTVLSYSKRKILLSFTFNLRAIVKWGQHFNSLLIKEKNDIDNAIRNFKRMK